MPVLVLVLVLVLCRLEEPNENGNDAMALSDGVLEPLLACLLACLFNGVCT